jgi:hypothetical protein
MTTPSKRTALSVPEVAPRREPVPPALVRLRPTRPGTLALRGPSSGRAYLFTNREATPVLDQDVDALLRTGALERAG